MAIQHPNIFYFVLDASWSSYNSPEFWNKGNTDVTVNNNKIYKTIYSPSPADYAEPKTAAFTGFTTTGVYSANVSNLNIASIFNKGYKFYCQPNKMGNIIFFSALGIRDTYSARVNTSNAGAVASVCGGGAYWSAGPTATSANALFLSLVPGGVDPRGDFNRAYGEPIYSVLNE